LQLLFIAKDHVNTGHSVEIIGGSLRIAPDGNDKGMGIEASCTSQQVTALAVGNVGYGTCVQDVDGDTVRVWDGPVSPLGEPVY
jgi:hypothetical protein